MERVTHYCVQCDAWTEHEREATLPARYQCGDPDYEDKTKCGRCGETYQCAECGVEWDVVKNECSAVLAYGHHGQEERKRNER